MLCPHPISMSPCHVRVLTPCPCPVPCLWGASPPWDPSTAHGADGSGWPLPVQAGRERVPHPGDRKGTSGCPHARPRSAGTPWAATSRAQSHQVALRGHRGHRCPAPNPTLTLTPNLSVHGHRVTTLLCPNVSPWVQPQCHFTCPQICHGHSHDSSSVSKSVPSWSQPE